MVRAPLFWLPHPSLNTIDEIEFTVLNVPVKITLMHIVVTELTLK